jgi:hypothetical protein
MPKYTIRPLDVGQFPEIDKSILMYLRGFGESVRVPIVTWAIEGSKERILYENWNGDRHEKHIPSGVHTDLFSCYQSFKKLEEIGAAIIPGHDMRIFDKPFYP